MFDFLTGVFSLVTDYCGVFSEYVLWAMAITTIGFIARLIRRIIGRRIRLW